MKVKKLDINNFRGFRKATIEFPDSNLAVFIGTNGKGKSSVLDLVAMFMTDFLRKIVNDFSSRLFLRIPFNLRPEDVNLNASKTENTILLNKTRIRGLFEYEKIEWTKSVANNWASYKPNGINPLKNYNFNKENFSTSDPYKINLPIVMYYVAQRLIGNGTKIKDKIHEIQYSQIGAYDDAFENNLNTFKSLIKWYREEEDIENEQMRRLQDFKYKNPRLEVLREAILIFFPKLGDVKFSNLRVERTIQDKTHSGKGENIASLVVTKNDQDFVLEQLSDGEKMLLMIVCDIARRLSIANPGLDNPLEGTGIVLIDEIELHLHPQWQREVIPALLATFPSIQFIVTTHSPQVLSRVDQSNIFLLKDGEVFHVSSNPQGLDTNAILEEIMDTPKYPKEVDDLVHKLFMLIQQKQFEQAEEIREQLRAASPDNPALSRADSMMERLKVLNQ